MAVTIKKMIITNPELSLLSRGSSQNIFKMGFTAGVFQVFCITTRQEGKKSTASILYFALNGRNAGKRKWPAIVDLRAARSESHDWFPFSGLAYNRSIFAFVPHQILERKKKKTKLHASYTRNQNRSFLGRS